VVVLFSKVGWLAGQDLVVAQPPTDIDHNATLRVALGRLGGVAEAAFWEIR